jgi:hypothetical protein
MEETAGRARAFAQGQDDPELLNEAIECCPVCCIAFVDHNDLITLEQERAEYDSLDPMSWGYPEQRKVARRSAAKRGEGFGTCCTNCPSKGCKNCPMYGVGLNPVYIARLEAREGKKAEREAAPKRSKDAVEKRMDIIFGEGEQEEAEDDMLCDVEECFGEQCVVECPAYISSGDMVSAETPGGEQVRVEVPEWAESGGKFWIAYNEADEEWVPTFREMLPPAATGSVVPPANVSAPPKKKGPAAEMESVDGVLVPMAGEGGAEDMVDVFAAIYQDPHDDERFGDVSM